MRDSRIGTYGTLALILSVGLRWQVLVLLAERNFEVTLVVVVLLAMLSRVAPVALLALLPPARAEGLGHSARAVPWSFVAIAGLIALSPGLLIASVPLLVLLVVLLVQAVVTLALASLARRRLGGQTGDVLGAAQQLAEIAGLLVLAALVGT